MRSANQEDIQNIRDGYEVPYDVMFNVIDDNSNLEVLAHRKPIHPKATSFRGVVAMETADGYIFGVFSDQLYAVTRKGPAHSPRKIKRKPVSGNRPFNFNIDDLAVGDKVKTRRKGIATITDLSYTAYFPVFKVENEHGEEYNLWQKNGREWESVTKIRSEWDIVGYVDVAKFKKAQEVSFLPEGYGKIYEQWPEGSFLEDVVYPNVFYYGNGVDDKLPEWFKDKQVLPLFRHGGWSSAANKAKNWSWQEAGPYGIIGFKIVK